MVRGNAVCESTKYSDSGWASASKKAVLRERFIPAAAADAVTLHICVLQLRTSTPRTPSELPWPYYPCYNSLPLLLARSAAYPPPASGSEDWSSAPASAQVPFFPLSRTLGNRSSDPSAGAHCIDGKFRQLFNLSLNLETAGVKVSISQETRATVLRRALRHERIGWGISVMLVQMFQALEETLGLRMASTPDWRIGHILYCAVHSNELRNV